MQPAHLHSEVPTPLGPEYSFATGGHTIAYGAERQRSQPKWPTTWGSKDKNLGREIRSLIKFRWRYRPQRWLLERSIVTLPAPAPNANATHFPAHSYEPSPMEGQSMFSTNGTPPEDSPSPPGVAMNPSRSKKASQSKKGKEPIVVSPDYQPSMASTGNNPLCIVGHLLLFSPMSCSQSGIN